MRCEGLPLAVPEGIHKAFVVFDRDRTYCRTHIECASFEHDTILIIHTRAFWKDQQWCDILVCNVLFHSFTHNLAILDLEPESERCAINLMIQPQFD